MSLWKRGNRVLFLVLGILTGFGISAAAEVEFVQPEKQRVIVLTDISNEPDDEESMVRFLVYSNEYDVDGLIATTSVWLRNTIRPERIRRQVQAYGRIRNNLLKHASGYPSVEHLTNVIKDGRPEFGMEGVGEGKSSEGSRHIIEVVDQPDKRPVWISVWAERTAWRRRCGMSSIPEALKSWTPSSPSCGSIRSPTRTTQVAGCESPFRIFSILSARAVSVTGNTTRRRGRALPAIGIIETRLCTNSSWWTIRGWKKISSKITAP